MRTRTRIISACFVLAAALVGGVAWATIPGTSGTIQGCYTKGNGNLRVVDNAGECRNSESAISWNDRGPSGETGPAGPQGPKGSDGAAGQPGSKGDTGATGPAGADGAPGTNGANGTDGAKGDTGAPGTDGTNGVDGEDGAAGSKGADGTDGTNGVDGANGAQGPQGATGPQGPQGPQGQPGAAATNVVWARVNADGSLAGGSGALSVGLLINNAAFGGPIPVTGFYYVNFDRSLVNCAIVASGFGIGVSASVRNDATLTGGGARVHVETYRGWNVANDIAFNPAHVWAAFSVTATC